MPASFLIEQGLYGVSVKGVYIGQYLEIKNLRRKIV
jgi:hypothetical protein